MVGAKKSVVCIEDEPEMIDLIKLILGRKGFELIGAMGGREGLDAIRRVKPDLVLLDLMMPDMDGWEVYQQIKADNELKRIPVIVVTAKAQSIDKVLGLHIAKWMTMSPSHSARKSCCEASNESWPRLHSRHRRSRPGVPSRHQTVKQSYVSKTSQE